MISVDVVTEPIVEGCGLDTMLFADCLGIDALADSLDGVGDYLASLRVVLGTVNPCTLFLRHGRYYA